MFIVYRPIDRYQPAMFLFKDEAEQNAKFRNEGLDEPSFFVKEEPDGFVGKLEILSNNVLQFVTGMSIPDTGCVTEFPITEIVASRVMSGESISIRLTNETPTQTA